MNIGIDLRTLMSGSYSGIPGFTYDLVTNILKKDSQNKYFGFYNSFKKSNFPDLGENIKLKKLNIPNKLLNSSLRFLKYPKLDKLNKTDLFYLPHFNFNALSKNTKKVITVHDLSFIRYPEFFSHKNNLWHKLVEVKKTLLNSDKIVAISDNTKNDLIELFDISENKIEVIYSGISDKFKKLDQVTENFSEIKNKYRLPEKFILSLGTIEPRKNISSLIEAFDIFLKKSASDYHLVIAGGMGWKYEDVLKKYENSPNKKRIHFLGYVDDNEKNVLYNLADLFVFPSYYEGFGFPPLEAMKAGTPVIASNNSSMLETLHNSAYFIDPYDINDLSDAIFEILNNNDLQRQLSERGVENSKKFSWETASSSYISLFNKI